MNLVPYEPSHVERLVLQPGQAHMRPYLEAKDYTKWIAVPGKSFTGFDGDRVLFCAGVIPIWEGRGEAWSLLGSDLKRDFLKIHNAVLRFFEVCDLRRIEANVDPNSDCAKRWVELLGFKFEGVMASYWPNGESTMRYARVK